MACTLDELRKLSLSELQISGGDDRLVLDSKTGRNKFNTPSCPCPLAVVRGSTTSNVISMRGHSAASMMFASLITSEDDAMLKDTFSTAMDNVRSRIMACYALPSHIDVVLTPSGSDAEYLPLLVALSRRPAGGTLNIVTAAGEVGSGTANACRGCHFSSLLPSGAASRDGAPSAMPGAGTEFMQTKQVFSRQAGGGLRPAGEIESEVEALVKVAIEEGRIPLVHIVVGSKTGATTPSEKFVRALQHSVGLDKVIVVVDACQGRVKENKVSEWLQEGWQVLVTGSTFFGAPPFCGAVLMQEEQMQGLESMSVELKAVGDYFDRVCFRKATRAMPCCQTLPDRMNFGLLLRWEAALVEMECFYSMDEVKRSRVMQHWLQGATQLVQKHGESCGHLKLALQGEMGQEGVVLGGVNSLLGFEVFVDDEEDSRQKKALNLEELTEFHAMMPSDLSKTLNHTSHELSTEDLAVLKRPCYIGQPVKLSSDVAVLSFAADAPLVNNMCISKDETAAVQHALADDEMLVKKIVLLAHYWNGLQAEGKKPTKSSPVFTQSRAMTCTREELSKLSLSELRMSGGDDGLVLDPKTCGNKHDTPIRGCPEAVVHSPTINNAVSMRGHSAASMMFESFITSEDDAVLRDTFSTAMEPESQQTQQRQNLAFADRAVQTDNLDCNIDKLDKPQDRWLCSHGLTRCGRYLFWWMMRNSLLMIFVHACLPYITRPSVRFQPSMDVEEAAIAKSFFSIVVF